MYNIQDSNNLDVSCSTSIRVSGTDVTSNIKISNILTISAGYIPSDKKLEIKTEGSLLSQDGYYDIGIGQTLKISNICKDKVDYFEIDEITESSNNTIITLYGKDKNFKEYFGKDYRVGTLDCYYLLSDNEIENLTNGEKPPIFSITNITENSFRLNIENKNYTFKEYTLRYKEKGYSGSYTIISFKESYKEINLLKSNTIYEVQVCGEGNKGYTFYSEIYSVKTL